MDSPSAWARVLAILRACADIMKSGEFRSGAIAGVYGVVHP